MGLNEDLIELSEILSDEQLIEYVLRLTAAENQFMKDMGGILPTRHRNYLLHTHSKRLKPFTRHKYNRKSKYI
jgi:hypothetical protein